MSPTPDWNLFLKRIARSHEMSRADIVECCRLGGLKLTNSRADAWNRPLSDRRRAVMTADEFDAFTSGLPRWGRASYSDNPSEP